MKAANPSIRVCSSDADTGFLKSMGQSLPYDCLQDDNYASTGTVGNEVPIGAYERYIMAAPQRLAQAEAGLEAEMHRYAGHAVPLVETEYGQLLNSNPAGYPYYHYSLDEALLNASQLVEWIRLGIPVADRQLVAAEIPAATQCCAKLPGAAPYASTGSIGTPGPGTVLEATGELYELFAGLAGGRVLPAVTLDNPVLATVDGQDVGGLLVLAVRKGHDLYLAAINRSPTAAVRARLLLEGSAATTGGIVARLEGASPLSYNTAGVPRAVHVTNGDFDQTGSELAVSLPADSVSIFRLPLATTRA